MYIYMYICIHSVLSRNVVGFIMCRGRCGGAGAGEAKVGGPRLTTNKQNKHAKFPHPLLPIEG